jgi:hypothetical protein
MVQRFLTRFALAWIACWMLLSQVSAQGLDTRASKDDWEEINFEFDSAVLSDGFPSLLRMAELLKANPAYRVKLEGHGDGIGPDSYNEELALKRAQMVRDFLVKYGAAASQIETASKGKRDPKVEGEKKFYSRTDVARWMNRRVVVTVMDGQGRTVAAGGTADAIRAMNNKGGMDDCCNEVLKRLDKLDDILKRLKDLADQNASLKKDIDDLKNQHRAMDQKLGSGQMGATGATGATGPAGMAGGNTQLAGGASGAGAAGAGTPVAGGASSGTGGGTGSKNSSSSDVRSSSGFGDKFSLLGLNVGADSEGKTTFSGRGRFFAPMGDNFAVQAQGEYLYFRPQKEAQFDIGLVNRIGRFQGGLFGSFKHVNLRGEGGTLGQAAMTADYLFKRGRVGIFGTKGFMDNTIIGRSNVILSNGAIAPNIMLERYLRIVDQAGMSGVVGLKGNMYAEGNIGYLRSYGGADRPGGTLRFVFPINDKFAFTMEGGVNETFMGRSTNGRAVFGITFGNLLRPKNFLASNKPVPVDIPRIRWELLTRRVRTGQALPPVADAGGDQIGVPAGQIRLDGSNSYDPNGEKLTYQWTQEQGPTVTLTAATSPMTNFAAAAGQVYVFRLTVRNESGLQASARVRVTVRSDDRVQILFFNSNPTRIRRGQTSELSWKVLNAEEVSINGIGKVAAEGRATVTPNVTTNYTLTAKNRVNEENATATVIVDVPEVRVVSCFVSPATIFRGESATLSYLTENAQSVVIEPGIGAVQPSGQVVISPQVTTAYRVIATGADGTTQSICNANVTVTDRVGMPRIVRFTADPTLIGEGDKSTLTWTTEGATQISISSLGDVDAVGSREVTPRTTTTYVLTASNTAGSVTAVATVSVIPAARITSFTANPPVSPRPGAGVLLTCLAENATSIDIQPNNGQNVTAQTQVFPTQDTTYTCTAVGPRSRDTKTVFVRVTPLPPDPGIGDGQAPVIRFASGPILETNVRQNTIDASQTISPSGDGPLTFQWTVRNGQAAIQNPTSPTTIVQLNQLIGDYYFDLTVTDAKGRRSTATLIVRLVKQPIPGPGN